MKVQPRALFFQKSQCDAYQPDGFGWTLPLWQWDASLWRGGSRPRLGLRGRFWDIPWGRGFGKGAGQASLDDAKILHYCEAPRSSK